jgi:hypothetical protein
MPIILGKSKALKPKGIKEIRVLVHPEKTAIEVAKQIAKSFGEQSKKLKPKKFIIR